MTDPEDRPAFVVNPIDDEAFASQVEAAYDQGARTPSDLQAGLRTRYPRAVVRRRGLSAELVDVWYVYRDGHWVPSGGREPGDRGT